MKQYNIPINNVIRHYDVTAKCCPQYYVKNPAAWLQLRSDIQEKVNRSKDCKYN